MDKCRSPNPPGGVAWPHDVCGLRPRHGMVKRRFDSALDLPHLTCGDEKLLWVLFCFYPATSIMTLWFFSPIWRGACLSSQNQKYHHARN